MRLTQFTPYVTYPHTQTHQPPPHPPISPPPAPATPPSPQQVLLVRLVAMIHLSSGLTSCRQIGQVAFLWKQNSKLLLHSEVSLGKYKHGNVNMMYHGILVLVFSWQRMWTWRIMGSVNTAVNKKPLRWAITNIIKSAEYFCGGDYALNVIIPCLLRMFCQRMYPVY